MFSIFSAVLFFQFSHVSSTVFSAPHKLASLFKMEEKLVDLLNVASMTYTSETLFLYLQSSLPSGRQLSAFKYNNQVLLLEIIM